MRSVALFARTGSNRGPHGTAISRWLAGVIAIGSFAGLFLTAARCASAEGWPQWLGSARDGVWREKGLIERFAAGGPKIVWRTPLGPGYSGPAVEGDRVYITDRQRAKGPDGQPLRPTRKGIPGKERILSLNAADGRVVWNYDYDCPYTISYPIGPRTTPLVHEKRVYCLGAMGDLICLDAAGGKLRWAKKLADAYKVEVPLWGYAAHPLIDGELLYSLVGGPGSAVVAFNKETGREVWKALTSAEIGYSPPMIYTLAGKRQLIIWLSDGIHGLDPATGKEFWKQEYPVGERLQNPAVNIITVRKVGDDMLFLSTFYNGPTMVKLSADGKASVVWKGKSSNPGRPDGAHCLMATPFFKDGYGYAIGVRGELRCFETKTGKELWQSTALLRGRRPDCGTVFLIPQGARYVLESDQGDLILADLSPQGYKEIDRVHILDPDGSAIGRDIVWSHPAFANRCIFARNNAQMICISMAKEGDKR
jgi:outer membrane protein assembly factor BamB